MSEDILLEYSIPTLEKLYDRVANELSDFKGTEAAFFTHGDVGCDKGMQDRIVERMENRLKYIEEAIAVHLGTLEYEAGAEEYDKLEIDTLTVPEKLKILTINQEAISNSDKTRKGNHLRMAGVNQSYYMFDAN